MNLAYRAKLLGLVTELTMLAFHKKRLETLPGQMEDLRSRLRELGIDPDAMATFDAADDAELEPKE